MLGMALHLRTLCRRFRRWFVSALGTRERLSVRVRFAIALLIFLLSFATRSLQAVDLSPLMYTMEQPFGGLTRGHDLRAQSILSGEGLLGPYGIEPTDTIGLSRTPGYSIFLSGVYELLGRNYFDVQLVQNGLNSLAPALIFLIAGRVVSWRVGVASGLLAAFSHHLSHFSNFILPDTLCALPILGAIYCLALASSNHRTYSLHCLAGGLIGMSAWVRPQSMLLGVFAAGFLWLSSRDRLGALKRGALLAVMAALIIAPITLRNYLVYHEFVPVSLGLGVNLWEGIADASGDRFGAVAQDTEVAAQEAVLYNDPRYAGSNYTPDGIQRDRSRTAKSLSIIRQHPFWYTGVMLNRMGEMLKYSAHAPLVYRISETRSLERTAPIRKEWRAMDTTSSSLAVGESIFWMRPLVRPIQRLTKETMQPMIALGALALFIAASRRALLISLVPLYYLLFQSFVHTEFRFTVPMQYFMFVFAATGWVAICSAIWQAVRSVLNKKTRGRQPLAAA